MQTSFAQLVRQQVLLKGLGFYASKVDGIWGPSTIEAKKRFEASPSFLPGLPNRGLPFPGKRPFPAGVTMQGDLLYHPCVDSLQGEEQAALKAGPVTRNKPMGASQPQQKHQKEKVEPAPQVQTA